MDPYEILSNRHAWHRLGSKLFHAAEFIRQVARDTPKIPPLVVGDVAAALIENPDEYWGDFERIPIMLHAMAVEAWLKGILVETIYKKIQPARQKLFERLSPTFVEDFWAETVSEADKELVDQIEKQDHGFKRDVEEALKFLIDHNLTKIAERCGLIDRLDDSERDALCLLSKMNQLGRYPAAFRADGNIDWRNRIEPEAIISLGKNILRLHDKLTFPGFDGN